MPTPTNMKDLLNTLLYFCRRCLSENIFVGDNWKKEKCRSCYIFEGLGVKWYLDIRSWDRTPHSCHSKKIGKHWCRRTEKYKCVTFKRATQDIQRFLMVHKYYNTHLHWINCEIRYVVKCKEWHKIESLFLGFSRGLNLSFPE